MAWWLCGLCACGASAEGEHAGKEAEAEDEEFFTPPSSPAGAEPPASPEGPRALAVTAPASAEPEELDLEGPLSELEVAARSSSGRQEGDLDGLSVRLGGLAVARQALRMARRLRPGTDLTRASLPISLFAPESALTLVGRRLALAAPLAAAVGMLETPRARFFAALACRLSMYDPCGPSLKKPFNPVSCEVHELQVEWGNKERAGRFLAEQVCHHPPVTAFHAAAPNAELRGVMSAVPRWHRSGRCDIDLSESAWELALQGDHHGEIYTSTLSSLVWRFFPVLGADYSSGVVPFVCERTGWRASFANVGSCLTPWSRRRLAGHVTGPAGEEFVLRGTYSGRVELEERGGGVTVLLFDARDPPTISCTVVDAGNSLSSTSVWGACSAALARGDYASARRIKREIEASERKRRRSEPPRVPRRFALQADGLWAVRRL